MQNVLLSPVFQAGDKVRVIDLNKLPGNSSARFDDVLNGEYIVVSSTNNGATIDLNPGQIYLFNECLERVTNG